MTPISPSGSPIATTGFVRVAISPVYQGGRQFYVENIYGEPCLIDVEDDVLRWLQVTVDLVGVDPEFARTLADASELVDPATTETRGVALHQGRNERRVALELWTRAVGDCPEPWGYFQLPLVRGLRVSAPLTVGREVANLSVAGVALPGSWLVGSPPVGKGEPSGLSATMLTSTAPPVGV